MAKSKKQKKEDEEKKKDEEQQKKKDQKYYAIAGGATGLILGAGISYFLFKDSPMSSTYKFLFSALIMIGNTIVPGYIGYYGGEAPDTIVTNILYYLALFILIVILLFNLKAPGVFDSFVLVLIFSSVFVISLKFGLKEDGSFSLFWIPILIIFGIIIALYYYFGYFAHVLKNIEKQWDEYDPDTNTNKEKDSSLQKSGGINEASDDTNAEPETKPDDIESILLFNIGKGSDYEPVFDALFKKFNPKTSPNVVSDVKKVENLENKYEGMGRRYIIMGIAAALLAITAISAIVFFIVEAVSKNVAVSPSNLFTSKLIINLWLLCVITIALVLIKFGINYGIKKYVPQAEPDNLLNEINKCNSITDFMNNFISSANPVQKGGGKIDKPDKKTNKNEKEMYLSLKI